MGKVKIKRKSTLIDMTAMSDVTVLLLTFFMLTSTFLQKEPVTVLTPSSVSTEKVPTANVATVLVSPEGKTFISIAGDADETKKDEWGSEAVRKEVLINAVARYKDATGKDVGITQEDIEKFSKINMFGIPLAYLHQFLQLTQVQQDQFISDMENPQVGIPFTTLRNGKNEFQIWMESIRATKNENLKAAVKAGEGIAVKSDQATPYSTINQVLSNLQDMMMNRFTVMTALKTEAD